MKNNLKTGLILTAVAVGLTFTSCSKKGCTDEVATNFDSKAKKDDGSCTYASTAVTTLTCGETLPSKVADGETLILQADCDYILNSALTVEDGGLLEIEEGVTVTASGGSPASMFIAIKMGGMIDAQGTDAKPIVFTATDTNPSAWGGISIAGKAPCNTGVDQEAEISGLLYGGTDAADNSGTLKYVRVEYSGAQINADKQFNGFSFYGVGSGTTIEYIQSYKGGDDGIEFFGGTVDIKYAVSTASGDDQFDFAEGWIGDAQYLYLEQLTGMVQDKGIEGDNLKANNSASPVSNPTISNVTIMGASSIGDTIKNADNEAGDGIRIREGANGSFSNIVIKNYGDDGIDARSLATLENINNGTLSFTSVYVNGCFDKDTDAKVDTGETDPGTEVTDAKAALSAAIVVTEPSGASYSTWKGNWTK